MSELTSLASLMTEDLDTNTMEPISGTQLVNLLGIREQMCVGREKTDMNLFN